MKLAVSRDALAQALKFCALTNTKTSIGLMARDRRLRIAASGDFQLYQEIPITSIEESIDGFHLDHQLVRKLLLELQDVPVLIETAGQELTLKAARGAYGLEGSASYDNLFLDWTEDQFDGIEFSTRAFLDAIKRVAFCTLDEKESAFRGVKFVWEPNEFKVLASNRAICGITSVRPLNDIYFDPGFSFIIPSEPLNALVKIIPVPAITLNLDKAVKPAEHCIFQWGKDSIKTPLVDKEMSVDLDKLSEQLVEYEVILNTAELKSAVKRLLLIDKTIKMTYIGAGKISFEATVQGSTTYAIEHLSGLEMSSKVGNSVVKVGALGDVVKNLDSKEVHVIKRETVLELNVENQGVSYFIATLADEEDSKK